MTVTSNEPSVVDAGEFTVRRTIGIAAPLEKVWAAITEPALISQWFPQRATLDGSGAGATGVFSWDDYGDVPFVIEELDEPRMIAYRWGNSDPAGAAQVDRDHSTVFRFTVEPLDDGGTRLTVVETGFDTLADPAAGMESNRGGWNSELDELVAYLEGGA
ncbi:SRPBCC family protein [Leifsonia poae]|uniref:ATPase n=1 Tax=Leifsonia poae TaxID=110933 RepID=A0A9W6H7B4_9MICO|nr:SRPBCC family protein [Leifsonia poae]GLJ74727.1 ATPase [Leifsonia poae]